MSVDPGAISTSEATSKVGIRHPNVTIDQSQVRHERNLQLKASRNAAKGVVTRRQNEAREIMSDFGDMKDLWLERAVLDEAMKMFNTTHQAYHGQLEDQTEIDDSQEYYDATLVLANETKRIIDDWIQVSFNQPQGANSQLHLQPEDSFSNNSSQTFSKSKTRSKAYSQSLRSSSESGAREAGSCLAMDSKKGYREAWKLLAKGYGQPYTIALASVERATNGPAIKSEDGAALQLFSVPLTSCKNTLTNIGYLSKIENPDSLKNMSRLPLNLRQK